MRPTMLNLQRISLLPLKASRVSISHIFRNYSTGGSKVGKSALSEVHRHFLLTSLRYSLLSAPQSPFSAGCVSEDEFLSRCSEQISRYSPDSSSADCKDILSTWNDAGLVYWCKESQRVWLKPELLRRRVVEEAFDRSQGLSVLHSNEERYQEYERLISELVPLHQELLKIHGEAEQKAERWTWFGAGALSTQGVVMAYMTWFKYGWDVIEPVTYFSGFTVAFVSFLYFSLLRRDFEYKSTWEMMVDRYALSLQRKNNFPNELYSQLVSEWHTLGDALKDESYFVYGHIDKSLEDALDLDSLARKDFQRQALTENSTQQKESEPVLSEQRASEQV